ncbi:MAG: hypothetical protein LBT14_03505 [Treponema sp.]|nr:hypothetical protein [Treponema sp.]
MRKARAFFFIVLWVGFMLPVTAQEADEPDTGDDVPIDSDWSDFRPSLYARGDQTFTITLGVVLPMFFLGDAGILDKKAGPVGGTGALSYNYFLGPHLFLGAEVGGMFIQTLGKNMLYIVPFGVRLGYQAVLKRFEFPLSLMVGGAPQKYLEEGYFGLFIKPAASVFFRFNPDWSFGLNAAWWFVPEWTREPAKDVYGNFLELTLSARYHF